MVGALALGVLPIEGVTIGVEAIRERVTGVKRVGGSRKVKRGTVQSEARVHKNGKIGVQCKEFLLCKSKY